MCQKKLFSSNENSNHEENIIIIDERNIFSNNLNQQVVHINGNLYPIHHENNNMYNIIP